jgi:hypothetical protein
MMYAPELSEKLTEAVELGFVWWPVTTALFGWETLRDSILSNSFSTYKPPTPSEKFRDETWKEGPSYKPPSPFEKLRDHTGDDGPFLDSKRSARYWAREEAAAWTPEF